MGPGVRWDDVVDCFAPNASLLPERPHQLVAQRLDQIRQHGAVAGLDEGFDRHAGDQLGVAEALDLFGRHRDADGVVALPGALVGGDVGRDAGDDAVQFRRGALVEGGQPQQRFLADLQLVDILRIDFGLDRQRIGLRHDHHDGVAGGDHAADGVNRRLQHHAVLRGADVGPPQLVLGGDLALDEFADLVVGLAQILRDIADQILVDLDDLQFGFGDLALGLRPRGDELRALAVEPGRVALQRRQARHLHQVFFVELLNPGELLFHQHDFLVFCFFLRRQAADFLVQLRDALAQLRLLPDPPEGADLEQFGLAGDDVLDVGVAGAVEQGFGKYDSVDAALLGLQPRATRPQPVEVLGDDGKARLGDGV